jgi:predicted metal-dependent hydrolase
VENSLFLPRQRIFNEQKNHSKYYLFFPKSTDFETEKVQHFLSNKLTAFLREEASIYLPHRLSQLANQYGFSYNRLTLRNQKTRWGSLFNTNNINLNIQLMRLPEQLCDYVLIHELCHTIHHNHSSAFYSLLESIVPDYKAIQREMKQYSTQF